MTSSGNALDESSLEDNLLIACDPTALETITATSTIINDNDDERNERSVPHGKELPICILITVFLSNTVYLIPARFLPEFIDDHNIKSGWTGLIFAGYAISVVIVSPLIGLLIDKLSQAIIMACGCILMSVTLITFSFVGRVGDNFDNSLLIAICLLLRLLQGAASSMINTSAYSFAAQYYTDDIKNVMSHMECIVGLGLISGPIIGSALYGFCGFSNTFLAMSIMIAPCAFLDYFMLKKKKYDLLEDSTDDDLEIDDKSITSNTEDTKTDKQSTQCSIEAQGMTRVENDEIETSTEIEQEELRKLRYCDLLRMPRIFFAASVAGISNFSYCIYEPTLELRLQDYDIDSFQVGVIFSIVPFAYMLSTFLLRYVVPTWLEIQVILMLNTISLGVFTSLVAPFYTDKSLVMMCIAFFFCGISLGPALVLTMPEMMCGAKEAYTDCDLIHANNLLSAILTSCLGIGQAIGPICGGILYDLLGFHWMCVITAFVCIVLSILYFVFADGWNSFRRTYTQFHMKNPCLHNEEQNSFINCDQEQCCIDSPEGACDCSNQNRCDS